MIYLIDLLHNITFIVIFMTVFGLIFLLLSSVFIMINILSEDALIPESVHKYKYNILIIYAIIILSYLLTPSLESIDKMREEYQKEQMHVPPQKPVCICR